LPTVKRNDARKPAHFKNQRLHVLFKPTPEIILVVPGNGDGKTKFRDIRPPSFDFMRKAKGFDIKKMSSSVSGKRLGVVDIVSR
jgi:hypothetical protein